MLKGLIVDDEVLSVRMLENIIDWNRYGIEIVASAYNGLEAVEKFRRFAPNIIVTDIRMPKLDGIEFIRRVRESNSDTEIVLTSAYADFNYVKAAISLGCTNYLLKPVDELELEKTLQTVLAKISDKDIARRLAEKGEQQKKKRILREYMKSGLHPQLALRTFLELPGSGPFALLRVDLNQDTINAYSDWSSQTSDQTGYIQEQLEGIARRHCGCLAFDYEDSAWNMLVFSGNVAAIAEVSQMLLQYLEKELRLSARICFSRVSWEPRELPELYQQARSYAKYSTYLNSTRILGHGYNCSEEEFNRIRIDAYTKDMAESLRQRNTAEALRVLDKVLVLSGGISPGDLGRIYEFCYATALLAKTLLLEGDGGAADCGCLEGLSYERLSSAQSMEQLRQIMTGVILSVAALSKPDGRRYSKLVDNGIEFLVRNYNRNLSLDEICEHLSVSKNYFSYLFKRDTGICLWDYLTDIRMNKSREFLETTGLKSYEIAYRVGYDNPSYFARLFKKTYGQTPNEYRAQSLRARSGA